MFKSQMNTILNICELDHCKVIRKFKILSSSRVIKKINVSVSIVYYFIRKNNSLKTNKWRGGGGACCSGGASQPAGRQPTSESTLEMA